MTETRTSACWLCLSLSLHLNVKLPGLLDAWNWAERGDPCPSKRPTYTKEPEDSHAHAINHPHTRDPLRCPAIVAPRPSPSPESEPEPKAEPEQHMQILLSRTVLCTVLRQTPPRDGSTPQAAAGTKQVLTSDRACDGRHDSHNLCLPRGRLLRGALALGSHRIAWPGLAWPERRAHRVAGARTSSRTRRKDGVEASD